MLRLPNAFLSRSTAHWLVDLDKNGGAVVLPSIVGRFGADRGGDVRVDVERTSDTIVLRLGLVDSIFALKRRLDVPAAHVRSIEVMDRSSVPSTEGTWLRAPGTYVPGLIRYGSYGREPKREFWLVSRHRRVVVIDVRDWAYHRLVLGVPDPDTFAATFPK
jgi:hypothetical protein